MDLPVLEHDVGGAFVAFVAVARPAGDQVASQSNRGQCGFQEYIQLKSFVDLARQTAGQKSLLVAPVCQLGALSIWFLP
jgi:hypothetical protein